jgi:glucuronate isomerase
MKFITEDFLLQNRTARRLYRQFAAPEPIFDYHCHLPPGDIAANRQFHNLFEIWLEGDHYKWRAMRANGVTERFCTGKRPPFEKFKAWAATVPHTLRNPLYHWTHLELKRYFGISAGSERAPSLPRWASNKKLAMGRGPLRICPARYGKARYHQRGGESSRGNSREPG